MSNPFTWPVNWQALATLLTGFAAVIGAIWLGNRQLQLRRDEIRLTLFERRREVLERFRTLQNEWQLGANLPGERHSDFVRVVRDVQLMFDAATHREVDKLFKDTDLQRMLARHIEMYSRSSDEKKRLEAAMNEHDKMVQIADRFPQLEALLVQATKIGHLFP